LGYGQNADSFIPVAYGKSYYLSFDAAYVGGSSNLLVIFPEFKTNAAFSGQQYGKAVTVTNPSYTHYVIAWTPLANVTVSAGLSFQPQLTGLGADTNIVLLLDNVQLVEAGYGMNDGFEAEPIGTTVTKSGAGAQVDNSTFSNWRIFTVTAPAGSYLKGTIVTNPATGGSAMQLEYNATGGAPAQIGFDRDWGTLTASGVIPAYSRIAVIPGGGYWVSFDAAWVSGGTNLQVLVPEYRPNHVFTGSQMSKTFAVTNTSFQHYSFYWAPLNTSNFGTNQSVEIGESFAPLLTGTNLTASFIIDNVQLTPDSPMVANGSFEAQPVGTTVTGGGAGNVVNTTTFSAWRVFSVASSGTRDDLVATLVTNATAGSVAMQVAWTNHAAPGADKALDNTGFQNPYVNYGMSYNISFDVQYVGGSTNLTWGVAEYTNNPAVATSGYTTKQNSYSLAVTNTNYQTITITNWTPQYNNVASNVLEAVVLSFRPVASGTTNNMVFRVDNIRFAQVGSVALSGLSRSYDALPKAATVTTTPAWVATARTYNGLSYQPLNPGSYTVIGTLSDPKFYTASATNTLVINKAAGAVSLGDLSQTYDGTGKAASATTTPPGLVVDLTYDGSPSTPTNAGSYTVVGIINDSNYQGGATNTLVIDKAAGAVSLGNLSQTYDGTGKAASATTTPPGLVVDLTYDGSPSAPTNTGSYTVVGIINDSNYQGGATNTLVIVASYATTPTNILYSVSGNTLALTWPGSHLGWYAQSNSVNLADTNYWFDIAGSQSATNLNITINPASPEVFYRLRLP
jgi:hypothetical protein